MIKSIFSTFFHKFLIVISNFLLVIVTSRTLGSIGRGEVTMFITDYSIILMFSGIIAGSAMAYFVQKKSLAVISLVAYLWSIPISVIGVGLIEVFHPTNNGVLVFGVVIVQSFTTIHQMILLGNNKLFAFNLNTVIQPVLTLLYVCYYFEVLGIINTTVVFYGLLYSSFISYLVSLYQTFSYYKNIELSGIKKTITEMLNYGTGTYISTIIQTITYKAGYYVLFWLGLSKAIGELSNGTALTEASWIISNSLSLVLYSNILNSSDEEYQKAITLQLMKVCFLLTTTGLLILIMIPSSVFTYIFGKDFTDLKSYILILSPGVLMIAISTVTAHYYSAKGNYAVNNIKSLLGLISVLLLLFIFVPAFGKKGAAFATSVSYTISSLYLFYQFSKSTSIPFRDLFRFKNIFSALVTLKQK